MSERSHVNQPYARLKRQITAEGLLDAQPAYYVLKTTVAILTLVGALAVAIAAPGLWVVAAGGVLCAFASTQISLLAHDVGHRQAYRGLVANRIMRHFLGEMVLGVSQSWWQDKHFRHHASPNHLEKDPDTNLPIVVLAGEQGAGISAVRRYLVRFQTVVFPMLLPFQALAMRVASVQYLRAAGSRARWTEGAYLLVHLALYATAVTFIALQNGWLGAVIFVATHQVLFGLYNSSVFASNHKGMEMLSGETRGFLYEQVATSRNVHRHWLTDFWYGGLNYQIEHHLFPTMPRNNLWRAQPIVEAFCRAEGIPYHSTGQWRAYGEIFSHLNRVGRNVSFGAAAGTPSE